MNKNNLNVMAVNKNQLMSKLGKIVPAWYEGSDCVNAYIDGIIPIKIKTELTQEEFDKLCGGM